MRCKAKSWDLLNYLLSRPAKSIRKLMEFFIFQVVASASCLCLSSLLSTSDGKPQLLCPPTFKRKMDLLI
jgi:hypothetical protein